MGESNYPTVIATIGGEGTRLYPLTLLQPKPLVPLVNYPIFTRMLEILARQGINKFIFASKGIRNTIHLKDVFRYGGGFSRKLSLPHSVKFMYQPNYCDKGSADAIRFSLNYYDVKGDIMVINGDNIADIKFQDLVSFHRKKGALATVVLKEITPDLDISQYGVAEVKNDNQILRFVEKPSPEKAPSKLINTGIYMFSSNIRDIINEMGDTARDIGGDLIPYLVNEGYSVYGLPYSGYWADVGSPDTFLKTTLDILAQKVENIKFRDEHKKGEGVWVHSSTSKRFKNKTPNVIKNTFIGGDCSIDPSVTIENSSIGDNCTLKRNSIIKDSIVMDFVNIGANVVLKGCIIGRYAIVDDNCVIDATNTVEVVGKKDKTTVIGDSVHILKNSHLGPYQRVAPMASAHTILQSGRFIDLGYDGQNIYFTEK